MKSAAKAQETQVETNNVVWNKPLIDTYDRDCVHQFGEYKYAFNFHEFRWDHGGRLELWKDSIEVGVIKSMFAVGMGLEDIDLWSEELDDYIPLPDNWLLQMFRTYPDGTDADELRLYEAAFDVAQHLGAGGIVSEWDEPKSKELWETIAPQFNATIKTQMITVGTKTANPRPVPVYIALFDAKENETK